MYPSLTDGGGFTTRYIGGADRGRGALFPERLEDWAGADNPVRVTDVFVDAPDLRGLGFERAVLLKLDVYGDLNPARSSRRLQREAGRNVGVKWLTGRLAPDHKSIADFRRDNGAAIRVVCSQLVALCRQLGLLAMASVALDGSKFKAVNNRDRSFTAAKMRRRPEWIRNG